MPVGETVTRRPLDALGADSTSVVRALLPVALVGLPMPMREPGTAACAVGRRAVSAWPACHPPSPHASGADLDCGPIIAQDVTHVTHRDTVPDMVRKVSGGVRCACRSWAPLYRHLWRCLDGFLP